MMAKLKTLAAIVAVVGLMGLAGGADARGASQGVVAHTLNQVASGGLAVSK